jgi:hypothetical protein
MQPTELQVQHSLRALTEAPADALTEHSGSGEPLSGAAPPDELDDFAADVAARLREASSVRDDRVASARAGLEAGEQPSAEALAQRMVGRLVCDRLR